MESSSKIKSDLQHEIQLLKDNLENVHNENRKLLENNNNLWKECEELNGALSFSETRLADLTMELTSWQSQIFRLSKYLDLSRALESQVSMLETAQGSLESELSVATKNKNASDARWRKSERLLEQVTDQFERLKQESLDRHTRANNSISTEIEDHYRKQLRAKDERLSESERLAHRLRKKQYISSTPKNKTSDYLPLTRISVKKQIPKASVNGFDTPNSMLSMTAIYNFSPLSDNGVWLEDSDYDHNILAGEESASYDELISTHEDRDGMPFPPSMLKLQPSKANVSHQEDSAFAVFHSSHLINQSTSRKLLTAAIVTSHKSKKRHSPRKTQQSDENDSVTPKPSTWSSLFGKFITRSGGPPENRKERSQLEDDCFVESGKIDPILTPSLLLSLNEGLNP